VNVLAARGSSGRGGTVVLNGNGGLGGEVSSIIRGDTQENSFVMVRAGTEAYVLITDLPAEQRESDDEFENLANTNNQIPGVNLSDRKWRKFWRQTTRHKLRAALLKMSPQFRALAIKAIEEGK
jgi:DNA-binding NarL/FixJ family response regulator